MKKTLLTGCILAAISCFGNNAKAEFKPYVGLNGSIPTVDDIDYYDEEDFLLGISFGSKITFNNNVFGFGEVYVNALNKIIDGKITYEEGDFDTLEFKDSYGIKLGLGYNINDKFNAKLMVSSGYYEYESYYEYDNGSKLYTEKYSDEEIGYGYGLGLGYNITENIEANVAYQFKTVDDVDLQTIDFGINYNF